MLVIAALAVLQRQVAIDHDRGWALGQGKQMPDGLAQIGRDCAAARAFWGLDAPRPALTISEARRSVLLNGREAALSPKEFELLRLLARTPGEVLTKEAIYQAVWREPSNGWLHAPADPAILFDADLDTKWERAIAKLGVSLSMLSGESGHA